MKDQVVSDQLQELRDNLQQLQNAADHLAQRQNELRQDLEQALQRVLEVPLDREKVSQFPPDSFVDSKEAAVEESRERSDVRKLRQQLSLGSALAGELTEHQARLAQLLKDALQNALELRHAEIEGRNDLGGEG